ncbi:ATPase [Nitratireductor mangrovi]|uniref:ATPase n=1 Tax=Nitratireductor mangrovi TaxID=2599600 RepID=A0A5B8KVV2_9HYPH|nr:ATP12 family protein [Nitratireductor mangrovi]QDY99639.1 ATPase [Nitratireductor mangrovi]
MREILSDLEDGSNLSDINPMKRAQKQMRQPLPKRFYKEATHVADDEGYEIRLDGKPVRTPGRSRLLLPNADAARLVADEFAAQRELIDPASMPVLRIANTVIDGVMQDPQAVLEDLLRFASSDLVCYRAESPERLVELQAAAWDPVLDWATVRLGARFVLAEGVMHVEQPRESIAAVGTHLRARPDPFRLACLHVMTTLTGSALIALACEDGAIGFDTAWSAAHVDEDWNIAQWGEDAEAASRRATRQADMAGAFALLETLR